MAVLIIALFALLGWIAHLKHSRFVAVGLVVLVGILIGNAPGSTGEWAQATADFLFKDVPDVITQMADGK